MKKLLILCLTVLLCLSVVGCGGTQQSDYQSQSIAPESSEDPTEAAKQKISDAYDSFSSVDGAKDFAKLSYDKSSLIIDTQPTDSGFYKYSSNATAAIAAVNVFLGLPASVSEKMSSTRALDGMQSQNCGAYTVTWTYHPDNGLRVIYEVNY